MTTGQGDISINRVYAHGGDAFEPSCVMRCQIRTVECRQNLAILGQLWPTKELEYHEYSSCHIQEQGAGMGQGLARTQPVRMSDFLKYFPILFLAKLIAPIKKIIHKCTQIGNWRDFPHRRFKR